MEQFDRFQSKYGAGLFIATFNGFMIDQGLCPDLPTFVRMGPYQINGVWQQAIEYRQESQWEDYMDALFGPLYLHHN